MNSDTPPSAQTRLGEALRELAGPEAPPAWLEDRVVAELSAFGHVRPGGGRRRRAARVLLAAAAAVTVFAAGAFAGARRDAIGDGPRYALLLVDAPGYTDPSPDELPAVIERYGDWAAALRRERSLVLAERLGETVAVVPEIGGEEAGEAGRGLLGVFVVVAPDDAAAAAIAAASPHAARGGRVVVVRIDPT